MILITPERGRLTAWNLRDHLEVPNYIWFLEDCHNAIFCRFFFSLRRLLCCGKFHFLVTTCFAGHKSSFLAFGVEKRFTKNLSRFEAFDIFFRLDLCFCARTHLLHFSCSTFDFTRPKKYSRALFSWREKAVRQKKRRRRICEEIGFKSPWPFGYLCNHLESE